MPPKSTSVHILLQQIPGVMPSISMVYILIVLHTITQTHDHLLYYTPKASLVYIVSIKLPMFTDRGWAVPTQKW